MEKFSWSIILYDSYTIKTIPESIKLNRLCKIVPNLILFFNPDPENWCFVSQRNAGSVIHLLNLHVFERAFLCQ